MSDLPYSDPSNPALPSPLFSDLTAVRADHMRANNAAIFADLIELNSRNPELVALTSGSFKTAALANANTYNGRSFFTCTAGVSDTPYPGAWRIFGFWNPADSSGRFVAMLDTSLETWEINYSAATWGTWTSSFHIINTVDTTAGDATVTLPALSTHYSVKVTVINSKGGTNKVIVVPGGTDKITADDLTEIWLPKLGDYITLYADSVSGKWICVSEKISNVLRLDTYAGYGSTDTKIMKFTNIDDNYGNMFSHNHGAYGVHGLEITILRSGRYGIEFHTITAADSSGYIGLSLNSDQLTTSIANITVGNRLVLATLSGNYTNSVSVQKYFAKGDVIRPHTAGNVPNAEALTGVVVTYLG